VKEGLLCGFRKVLVVATDQADLRTLERALGRDGLIIPTRVTVALAGAGEYGALPQRGIGLDADGSH
jgi:hypothetical protein